MNMDADSHMEMKDVVCGHHPCQSEDAKWLCLVDINEKFHRPNFYDIGGTYVLNVADFWFMFKTEQVGDIFLLHLFVINHQEGPHTIELSETNSLRYDNKVGKAYLSKYLQEFLFKNLKEKTQTYLKTFSFSDLDVEILAGKKLFIALAIPKKTKNSLVYNTVKVNHDFRDLLSNPIGADFVIEAADGKQLNVHKSVLATQSDVFKAMLKEETAESQNNFVKIIDVAYEDLQHILEFIYTGTILNMQSSNFFNLLILADRYHLKGLSELSEYALCQQITSDNALEILVVADMYNSDILKIEALKFIKKNSSVLQTRVFEEIKNAQLLRELCAYLARS